MTTAPERTPYAHALFLINDVGHVINRISGTPQAPLPLNGDVAAGVLTARSNLAIASALLAVADAIRERQ